MKSTAAYDVMLDLESMSVKKNAAIIQIGAVLFDPWKPGNGPEHGKSFEININLQSAVMCGGDYDPSTMEWWKSQSTPAKESVCDHAYDIGTALMQFRDFMNMYQPNNIWANGAADDIPWLGSAFERMNIDVPWRFNTVRDTRTLFDLATLFGWKREYRETAHTALQDCIDQANDVCSANAFFRSRMMVIDGSVTINEIDPAAGSVIRSEP